MAGAAALPGLAHAQISDPKTGQGAPVPALPDPVPRVSTQEEPIVPDAEFEAALPKLSDDINAPLEPIKDFQAQEPAKAAPTPAPGPSTPPTVPTVTQEIESFAPAAAESPEFAEPLQPLSAFKVEPASADDTSNEKTPTIRYTTVIEGLDKVRLDDRFRALSALENGDGKAVNAAMVSARAREDEKLAVRLMQSLGYYDGTAVSTIEQNPKNSGNLRATVAASPGSIYRLGTITIVSGPTVPPGLLDRELNLNPGDPIQADRVQGAEANVSLRLPQQGYPFTELGERDILLDEETHIGDYTLPVTLGPRASFGKIVTEGRRKAFGADHIELLKRYKPGQIYDSRAVDDLREALIATSLFSTISVEPQKTGQPGPDGTEVVDLLVKQAAGRPRTIAAELGYSTGQGIRLEGSWTHRNLFPPEGALIASGVLGTQEQGVTGTFRRSNAGLRDRTFQLQAGVNHKTYNAFKSYTGSISARMSRDSTPIWQKRWTYYYGLELLGTNEDRYNFNLGQRDRGTWLIAALPMYGGYDSTDNLLNPTKGFRIKANISPETSVRVSARPYERFMLEGTAYYPVSGNIVIAGRARAGSIAGIARNDLPPSRRYYAGGGGSVRGFGYQELGPRSPDGRPVGGRAFNEFAIEARYRFGNFGIVPFVDAGQVYEGIYPTAQDLRFGAGIGGRLYTNFGPIRVDVATPIARKPGESKIALYISIGQAF
ncbi:BamA/TamA family outer membrane protein [Sphingomonas sp. JC676]|uniref:autotransporter assembly complex protein TamA n=1 Tax=Sphingomonas sp. JC676 TaxID=2768065 RepID=UPI001657F08D|nr:BamA/TamA family outer membrane protein [Sphingomonas sp. JC676]MBC9031297.1 BamA/TamA family outer membrane protein [Sphingomonas sp. JC676]